jgi:predicted TIM-barrel fold metal-dependent hydrolase
MNVLTREQRGPARPQSTRQAIADVDIHPLMKSDRDLYPFLSPRWQAHWQTYGAGLRMGMEVGTTYPKSQPGAWRRDAYPPGGKPGSDLGFMRQQHLDPNNVQLGILLPLRGGQGVTNIDFSIAYCAAVNDWQVAAWTSQEKRLRASIVVPYEDGAAAAEEIERRAGNPDFAQVQLYSRTSEPLGHRRYWPIYAAAERLGLPVAVHAFGFGGHAPTGSGWPSFYFEEAAGHAQTCQSMLVSLVMEGVFERFPRLRFVMVEAGFAWLPSLAWRLDRLWQRLGSEVPHLTMPPSAYIRRNVWSSSQPIEEPEDPAHLFDVMRWIGWDRLLFATDYPHWDFDDPARALPAGGTLEQRQGFFLGNALALYSRA